MISVDICEFEVRGGIFLLFTECNGVIRVLSTNMKLNYLVRITLLHIVKSIQAKVYYGFMPCSWRVRIYAYCVL